MLWVWCLKDCPCQFWVCINYSIVKIGRVTHYHIKCLIFDLVLWPWHWKACPRQLSLISASILKMDIATLYHLTLCNKVTWTILVYLNICIVNDYSYVNMELQYRLSGLQRIFCTIPSCWANNISFWSKLRRKKTLSSAEPSQWKFGEVGLPPISREAIFPLKWSYMTGGLSLQLF